MADGGIIVTKKVVFKAVDEVTRPLASMNQRISNLESKLSSLGMKFSSGASEQQTFKQALNETKASAGETASAIQKTKKSIEGLKNKSVKVNADTQQGTEKVSRFKRFSESLNRVKARIKAMAETAEANRKLKGLGETAKGVGHSFVRLRTIIAGTAVGNWIGNGVAAGIGAIKNGIVGAAKAGIQFNMTMQEMHATWDTLTGSSSKAKSMSNSIVDLSNKLGWGVDVTNELAQQFYHVFNNQPETMKLTKSFLTMGDAIGLSSDRLKQVGMDFTHMLSSSKLQLGDMNQITDAFPMFGEALLKYERKVQHNSHLTMSQLRKDISAGKISAKDAEKVFNGLGSHYKKASENLMGTLPGMFRQISAKWKQLMGDAMAPSTDAANPVVKQVSMWIKDKRTTQEFENLGKAVNTGVGSIMQALANSFGNGSVSKMLDNVVQSLTKFVEATSKWTARNAGSIVLTIKSLGSIAGSLGKGAFEGLADLFKLIPGVHGGGLKAIAEGLSAIAKHRKALELVGRLLAVQFAYSKLFKMAKGLGLVSKGVMSIGKVKLKGNIFGDLLRNVKVLKKIKINPVKWFKGGSNWVKNLFKPAEGQALRSADTVGGNFMTRLAAKTNTSKFAQLGRTTGGKLVSGVGLALEAYDMVKDLHGAFTTHNGTTRSRDMGKVAGAGIGAGIGFFFGGPAGAALGGLIGRTIGGKIGPSVGKFGKGIGKVLNDIFVKHNWNKVWSDIGKGWQSFWKGMGSWWDKTIGKKGSHSSSFHKSKTPSRKKIKSLGGNHYSKRDIVNIKEMNRAVLVYTETLKYLKQVIKHNDPTKQLNKMNRGLKRFVKDMQKSEKPLGKIAKTFKTFGKSTKTMATSIKSLTGKHGLGEFTKDLDKLNKNMKHTKVGSYFEKLAKSIKKSKLAAQIKNLDKWLSGLVNDFKHLDKPLKQSTKSFNSFEKSISKLASKKTGLSKVDSDIIKLSKDLKKYDFGKTLSRQMTVADKAMGKHGFIKQFTAMMTSIEMSLRSFSKSMKRDWGDTWKGLSSSARQGLNRAKRTVSSELDAIDRKGDHFESKFFRSWSNWLSDLVSVFRNDLGKLPGIAEKAMSGIVGRLNKGISGINKVIGDFGGDKKLGTISYAHGTFSHPGGKALINDGLTPYKQELVWQPSKGWSVDHQQNAVRDLEAGAIVIDAQHSRGPLSRFGGLIPHYASGTLSDDEMDKIAEQFENSPVAASKDLILKLTNWSSSTPIVPSFGKATAIGFSRGISNVLKDLLGEVKEPVNGDWTPVIRSAAAKMHFHIAQWQINKLLRQIQTESGGNEKIKQQISDQNSAAGHPAQGLLQFIPSTFNTWALPGHHNILSGFDQIMAAINALNHGGEGGWGNIGNGHGWASGVHMTHPDYARIADNPEHDEYVINPYNSNALPLMKEAWQTMTMAHPELRSDAQVGGQYNGQVVSLLKDVVSAINGINLHPQVVLDTVTKEVNRQNARDWRLSN